MTKPRHVLIIFILLAILVITSINLYKTFKSCSKSENYYRNCNYDSPEDCTSTGACAWWDDKKGCKGCTNAEGMGGDWRMMKM